LPNTLHEIRGHARIERTVPATGEDIHAWLLHSLRLLDSDLGKRLGPGLRRDDRNDGKL
jgi:hypothetical protein